jgi:hypothetical protein
MLSGMAANSTFLKEFPFLKRLNTDAAKKRGGCCGANNKRAALFTAAKQAIVSLDAARKKRLKELLNAERVRLMLKQGSKVREITF